MIAVVLALVGLLLGAAGILSPATGWFIGGVMGFAVGRLIVVQRRLDQLERQFSWMMTEWVGTGEEKEQREAETPRETPPLVDRDFVFEGAASHFEMAMEPDHDLPKADRPARQPRAAALEEEAPPSGHQLPEWVTGGNLLVKIGVVILFFGVAFLLKFASEYGLLPIELRLAAAAAGGMALLLIGWRLRERRMRYALALQGGGVGVLYLTIFAALRLYHLLPAGLALALLVALCALSAVLAVIQESRSLAILGFSGGFLAPVLASTGSGSHVVLFGYYALLNAGIIGIAWYRSWRLLNLVGFVFTFGIGAMWWGAQYYRPAHFATVEPFLLLFVAMFVAAAILHSHRQPPELKGYVDGTLVFGTPIVAFALQCQLVGSSPHGLAWSAAGFGLFYLACAWLVFARLGREARLLAEAFLAFSVIFGTLAIPLALEGHWTAAAWAIEGAALVWIGVRQERLPARVFGVLLLFAAGFSFPQDLPLATGSVLNGFGALILAGSALAASWYLHRYRETVRQGEVRAAVALFVWGMLWWFQWGAWELWRHLPEAYLQGGLLLFLAASATACSSLERRLSWPWLSWPALGVVPLAILLFFAGLALMPHPFAQGGFLGWPVVFIVLYRILKRQDHFRADLLKWAHAAALWLLTAILTAEGVWWVVRLVGGEGVWPLAVCGLIPSLVVLFFSTWGLRLHWPVREHAQTYLVLALAPLVLIAWLWGLYANLTSNADPRPLPYLPLLNPLDVAVGFFALALWCWKERIFSQGNFLGIEPRHFNAALVLSLFVWFNGMLVRTVHHWGQVPFDAASLSRSILLQASLSLAWSLTALGVMTVATRRGSRQAWMGGSALLALVVVKLFLVDLSGTGTIERIVSFLGVGVLILLIGWFAPAPPSTERSSS